MYTQGQAVLNRSFFPGFDTPSVKSTYSATIKVPEGFTAVMSATTWEKQEKDNTFTFKMSQPIPSYLIALAVGDIVSAEVGPRSHVWAEPCLIEAARKEYDGVIEEFLAVGEKLFGPYVWDRYDVLFMPPSFPFGGMENPCITFVTPCLLAGDRSLVDVIIHEISHSWFGNLVTNANWGEFWLNEGFTMYAQRRISTVVYGAAYTCLEAATGRALLRQHMDNTGEDHPLNKLRVKIEPGVDPDDTYNETPYEKGYCFVSYLAHLVGDQSKFDAFLQAYVNQFKFQSIMADEALEFFLEYFPELKKKGVATIPGFEFDRWLNTPGWPPYLPDLSPGETLMKPAEGLAELWAASSLNMEAIKAVDITAWKTYQLVFFLDKILQKSPLPDGTVAKLSETYPKISRAQNAELRLRWCQIVLKNSHEPEFGKVKEFLHSQGKQKYTLPLYRAMWSGSESARALAVETFSATASKLHVNVQNYVKKILASEPVGT
ncbi:aminopeptidase B [Natator depressus]|uniref:aminopeptidase B n=1 Tax=Natator depressus TaxID=27790 RepID=UPI003EB8E9AA